MVSLRYSGLETGGGVALMVKIPKLWIFKIYSDSCNVGAGVGDSGS